MGNGKTCFRLGEALDKEGTALTHFSKLIKGVVKNENGKHEYQDIQLKQYKQSRQSVKDHCLIAALNFYNSVEMRFEGIFDSLIFTNKESLLDTFTWSIMGDCGKFGNKGVA